MTLLRESLENKKYDVRVVEKNITRNVVDAKDYSKFVDQIEDASENAQWVSLDEFTGKDLSKS